MIPSLSNVGLFINLISAPDKRPGSTNNEPPPNIPKRGQKKLSATSIFSIESIVDISLEDSNHDSHLGSSSNSLTLSTMHADPDNHDLRDSGISITDNSHLNNFNHTCYDEFDLRTHQQEMNINASPQEFSPKIENPPPIPPKAMLGLHSSLNSSFDMGGGAGSLERKPKKEGSVEVTSPGNYSVPKLQNETQEANKSNENPC